MSPIEVLLVRGYLGAAAGLVDAVTAVLAGHEVTGWTVLRGISGCGESGKVRSARTLDLSLDLPVTIEFFDTPARVQTLMPALDAALTEGHVVNWAAMRHL